MIRKWIVKTDMLPKAFLKPYILRDIKLGKISPKEAIKKYAIPSSTLYRWLRDYKEERQTIRFFI